MSEGEGRTVDPADGLVPSSTALALLAQRLALVLAARLAVRPTIRLFDLSLRAARRPLSLALLPLGLPPAAAGLDPEHLGEDGVPEEGAQAEAELREAVQRRLEADGRGDRRDEDEGGEDVGRQAERRRGRLLDVAEELWDRSWVSHGAR